MDKTKAEKIFYTEGETANSIGKAGSLITNPDVLVELFVNGDSVNEHSAYGCFHPIDETTLDYFVHRLKDVTLKEKESFYKDNTVRAQLYVKSGEDEVVEKTVKATTDGWEE